MAALTFDDIPTVYKGGPLTFDDIPSAPSPREQGFLGRMGKNLQGRMQDVQEAVARTSYSPDYTATQDPLTTLYQIGGEGFGAVGDVLGEGAISAFRALPDAVEMPMRKAASSAGEALMQTELGQQALDVIKEGAESYTIWREQNPVGAANVEALFDISTVLPTVKPLAATGQTVAQGVKAGGRQIGRAAGAVFGSADDALKVLGRRAKQFDIPLRMDQIKPSQMTKTLQKVSQAIPGSGTAKFEDIQRTAWNKALAKTIGTTDLTPESIAKFRSNNSTIFDDVLRKNTVKITPDDVENLKNVQTMDVFDLTPNDYNIVVRDIAKTVGDLRTGQVSGQKVSAARSYLLDKSTRAGNATPFYNELIDRIDDVAKRSLNPADNAKLNLARKQYKNFKTMQPLLQEGMEVDPNKLMQRVKSSRFIDASSMATGEDELVDLARIGKHLLKKQGGSDTFEKGLMLGGGGLGGYGAATLGPVGGATAIGGALAGNRALQTGVLRNQALMNQMLDVRPQSIPLSEIMKLSPQDAMTLLGTSSGLAATKASQ